MDEMYIIIASIRPVIFFSIVDYLKECKLSVDASDVGVGFRIAICF
jgi:hypothetical protein